MACQVHTFRVIFRASGIARSISNKSGRSRVSRDGKEPGSEAVFDRELKKMKDKVAVGPDADDDMDKHAQDALLNMTQDYAKRGTAMRYAKQARFFGRKPEHRKLTWDNIDRIRFLRQEHPEENDIADLAASFEVSENTIRKVLKSKFTPGPDRRQKQDLFAQQETGLLEDSSLSSERLQSKGAKDGSQLVESEFKEQPAKNVHKILDPQMMIEKNSDNGSSKEARRQKQQRGGTERLKLVEVEPTELDAEVIDMDAELEEAEEFGSLLPSDFVEAFEKGAAPPKIIQKGREFYDEDGEFLFRV